MASRWSYRKFISKLTVVITVLLLYATVTEKRENPCAMYVGLNSYLAKFAFAITTHMWEENVAYNFLNLSDLLRGNKRISHVKLSVKISEVLHTIFRL